MSSFLFLAAVIGVVWLTYWVSRNDAYGIKGGMKGLFAMKDEAARIKRKSFVPKWKQKSQKDADQSKRRW